MPVKDCCEEYVLSANAKVCRDGRFTETHKCPKCGTSLLILFEGIRTLGQDHPECTPLAIDGAE